VVPPGTARVCRPAAMAARLGLMAPGWTLKTLTPNGPSLSRYDRSRRRFPDVHRRRMNKTLPFGAPRGR
jgi:hypothetical protein